MSEAADPLSRAETGDLTKFSKLEASLINTEVERRPNSRAQNDIYRHAEKSDIGVNELKFDFDLDTSHYPLDNLSSLQQVFDSVQCHHHLKNAENFSPGTHIHCLQVDSQKGEWQTLDEDSMESLLLELGCSRPREEGLCARKMVVFFVPLVPSEGTSYGSRVLMTRENARMLLQRLEVNPMFLLNLIGRPDYWAPQRHLEADQYGDLIACDFFCQHPRWNLQVQKSPLSVYMRHDIRQGLTTYIISHHESDTSIVSLKSLLNIALRTASEKSRAATFLDGPFDIHVILSTLSLEASKFHVERFRRFMWSQINKVDDHLAGPETTDRAKLGDLTKKLQIISQNADSHIANADVAIITATGIRDAHLRLKGSLTDSSPFILQRVEDSISYVISSMEKQKMWFLNYKQRKDSTMSLVYNLVTQQDAANNIQISHSMKQDSTSMNAIAALTMVFLPGTFAGTLVGAGVFGGAITEKVWLIWACITVPLTLLVMLCWWLYQKMKYPVSYGTLVAPSEKKAESDLNEKSYPRRFSSFSFRTPRAGRQDSGFGGLTGS
ncbi:uncharacterized protein N7483_011865 [Penicillium malachiteum]|uniref:uncharacterized protein n=1 Tax=Penicillium malachiteum TaxID=1324776 RepID=UPI0025495B71|nr:uncharacterized protein N7483_011865 [Penicillium malachiteum]KAJ5714684.1 hypothetical protein N7483_011865 [Penicillium malachiteum]